MEDNEGPGPGELPESLLPYDQWTEDALRQIVVRALQHAVAHGLPGGHHFYVTFRTDQPGVAIPNRLLAQYPQEMTIVLQHQYWDLLVDEANARFTVGLSFGGVPSTLTIPFAAIVAFTDPQVRYALRFNPAEPVPEPEQPEAAPVPEAAPEGEAPQVVSLDAFRRRPPPK
jgi:hypothetical protein